MNWRLAVPSLAAFFMAVSSNFAAELAVVVPFDQPGVIVEVSSLFAMVTEAARQAGGLPAETMQADTAGRAFVTVDGVFTFLETPENQKNLAAVPSGSAVQLKGRLLSTGLLVQVDQLSPLKKTPAIDLKKYAKEKGTAVTLQGTNKCQCGLSVGDLPHSCTLGHLHHLEASDRKIYHYLQLGEGQTALSGAGSHFKKLEVKGRVFPGNFLLIQEVKLMP